MPPGAHASSAPFPANGVAGLSDALAAARAADPNGAKEGGGPDNYWGRYAGNKGGHQQWGKGPGQGYYGGKAGPGGWGKGHGGGYTNQWGQHISEAEHNQIQASEAHRQQALSALLATSKAIVKNTISTSKKKKAQMKAEAAKARKLMNPLTGEALHAVSEKNKQVDDYHAGRINEFFLGDVPVRVARTPENKLRKFFGVKGRDLRFPWRKQHFKYSVVYDVQIEDEEEEFCVVSRMGGNDGENLRNIIRTNKEVHLSLLGSRQIPLHLKIDCDHQEAYEYAMKSAEIVLRKVYLQLDAWAVDKDHVGKNISLEIRKVEKNTAYQSVLPENQPDPMWPEEPAPGQSENEVNIPKALIRARGADSDGGAARGPDGQLKAPLDPIPPEEQERQRKEQERKQQELEKKAEEKVRANPLAAFATMTKPRDKKTKKKFSFGQADAAADQPKKRRGSISFASGSDGERASGA